MMSYIWLPQPRDFHQMIVFFCGSIKANRRKNLVSFSPPYSITALIIFLTSLRLGIKTVLGYLIFVLSLKESITALNTIEGQTSFSKVNFLLILYASAKLFYVLNGSAMPISSNDSTLFLQSKSNLSITSHRCSFLLFRDCDLIFFVISFALV